MFDEMPTPMAPVDNTYDQFIEDVIYNGGHVPAYDPDETQSQDGRAQFVADEEADDRADYDHGDSWHGDDDIYCEGDGDEYEVNDTDSSGEPLFIDELTQRAEAKKKKKSVLTSSYTQDEDKLICNSWMEISQDPRTGAQQKGLVFWTRVHKTSHERKMFEPYQITSDRGITSIQKRWLVIQQECNKYCTALESIEARPMSGLGIVDMAFQSLEAFKARHNNKPFTLTHCWTIINDFPKFKDQYRELQRKRGKKTANFAGGGDGEALKRPRGKTNSKVDDIRDAASMALHKTLHSMMSRKDMRDEKKQQSKDNQMKQYLELQRKKLEMEEEAKKRKIDLEEVARQRQLDIEAANVEARKRQLDIEATNAATKAKEVALVIMSVDLTKMSEKTRRWLEARQKEMFDADGLN
ncbi:putative DBINO protein [Hordeum vulgare]|nr:putative DBINO protein [Hordeum vulgare]